MFSCVGCRSASTRWPNCHARWGGVGRLCGPSGKQIIWLHNARANWSGTMFHLLLSFIHLSRDKKPSHNCMVSQLRDSFRVLYNVVVTSPCVILPFPAKFVRDWRSYNGFPLLFWHISLYPFDLSSDDDRLCDKLRQHPTISTKDWHDNIRCSFTNYL